jgi:hypothetical protein
LREIKFNYAVAGKPFLRGPEIPGSRELSHESSNTEQRFSIDGSRADTLILAEVYKRGKVRAMVGQVKQILAVYWRGNGPISTLSKHAAGA